MSGQHWCGTCQEIHDYYAKFAGLQFTADEIRVALFDLADDLMKQGVIQYWDQVDPRIVLDALYEGKTNR